MLDEHAAKVPCPEGCNIVPKGSKWLGVRKGADIDVYYYDVVNEKGEVVSSHEVYDSTSTYPPFGRSIYLKT